jgi:metallo-beta-lactamase class B
MNPVTSVLNRCCKNIHLMTLSVLILCMGISMNVTAQLTPDRLDSNNRADNHNELVDPFRIIDNLWWVGHSQVGSFLITTTEGHILIDPTSTLDVHGVVQNIVKAGYSLSDIKYILNTHPHEEHVGGMAALQRLLPHAEIVVSKGSAHDLASGGKSDFRNIMAEDGGELFEPVVVDKLLGHLEQISLGGTTITAHLTPGHTTGTTSFTFKVKDGGKQYDVLIFGGMSASGAERGPLIKNELYPEIADDFEKSFRHLKTLNCEVYLYPRGTTIELDRKKAILDKGGYKVNPFVDPEGCRSYIEFYEARYKKQLEEEAHARMGM